MTTDEMIGFGVALASIAVAVGLLIWIGGKKV